MLDVGGGRPLVFVQRGWTPALVLGVFHTKVKSNGDTHGANLAFHVNLAGGINPGKLKLSSLNGQEHIQCEIGAGYDFMRSAPLLGLGLNGPFVAAGVDGYLSHGLVPWLIKLLLLHLTN